MVYNCVAGEDSSNWLSLSWWERSCCGDDALSHAGTKHLLLSRDFSCSADRVRSISVRGAEMGLGVTTSGRPTLLYLLSILCWPASCDLPPPAPARGGPADTGGTKKSVNSASGPTLCFGPLLGRDNLFLECSKCPGVDDMIESEMLRQAAARTASIVSPNMSTWAVTAFAAFPIL
jgi:hypothetical protein